MDGGPAAAERMPAVLLQIYSAGQAISLSRLEARGLNMSGDAAR